MANQLEMAKIDTILALYRRHWSIRRIARELGLHRDTVARHLQVHRQAAQSVQPIPTDGKTPDVPAKPSRDSTEAKQATPEGGAQECKIGHPAGGRSACKIGHPTGGAQDFKIGQAPIGVAGVSESALAAALVGAEQLAPAAAGSPAHGPAKQASLCEPWRQVIMDKLAAGLSAQRIYQDLVTEHGFRGQYHSVRRIGRRATRGAASRGGAVAGGAGPASDAV